MDNLWDLSTCPVNAFNGRLAGFRAFWLPYPYLCPENVTMGREMGLPGIARAKKTPRMAGQEKTPG